MIKTTTRTPFTTQTPIGTKTNFGEFVGFDKHKDAHFVKDGRKNFVGSKILHFVQVIN
jgi:hypothetical protein